MTSKKAATLTWRYRRHQAADLMAAMIRHEFAGRVAVVSSFGTESAVLLHLAAKADRAVPVVFIDTGKLFPETLEHRDRLVERLRLTDVRSIGPRDEEERVKDPTGRLWRVDADACCFFRKVLPLRRALDGFDAWFTGRKRFQGGMRDDLPLFEEQDGRVKINPLAGWTPDDIDAYMDNYGLPRHPLGEQGYASVGCVPCTAPIAAGEDRRAGRWKGQSKTECGIHLG